MSAARARTRPNLSAAEDRAIWEEAYRTAGHSILSRHMHVLEYRSALLRQHFARVSDGVRELAELADQASQNE